MGDTAEVFKEYREYKKEQRDTRAAINAKKLTALGIDAKMQSKNVYRIEFAEREVVMYYLSSNSWQHRGKVYRGTPEQLKSWLKMRGAA